VGGIIFFDRMWREKKRRKGKGDFAVSGLSAGEELHSLIPKNWKGKKKQYVVVFSAIAKKNMNLLAPALEEEGGVKGGGGRGGGDCPAFYYTVRIVGRGGGVQNPVHRVLRGEGRKGGGGTRPQTWEFIIRREGFQVEVRETGGVCFGSIEKGGGRRM